jgi:hypothetical protein
MSGPAEGTAGLGRRSGRRGAWAGLVIGIIVVSGAVVAVLHDHGDDGDGDGREASPQQQDEPVEISHEWPAAYGGQVWITITAADAAPRSVTIRWGPWERHFVHESDEPLSYWFTKNAPKPGDENVPTTVTVSPGADVAFDQGTPPVGAIDQSTGWEPAPDDGDDPPPS